MALEPFLINPVRRRGRRRRRRARRNPMGDELVVLGLGNPRRRSRMRTRARRRRRRRGGGGWLFNARRRRRRPRYHFNAPGRRRRRRRRFYGFRSNSPRRHRRRRHYRRNPAAAGLQIGRWQTWAPYVMTGAVSAIATAAAPSFMGPAVTPMWAYGVQGAVAVGGAIVLPMLGFRGAHGMTWFVVSGAVIVADMIKRYVMPMVGLAAYPYDAHAQLSAMGQEPYYPPRLYAGYGNGNLEAYPFQEGMGAYEAVPGAPMAPFEVGYGR